MRSSGRTGLGVVSQQVVPVQTGTSDRWSLVETSMRAVPVVVMQPAGYLVSGLLGVLVSASIGPFAQSGLDEAFGLAMGARGVGTSEALANVELSTSDAKGAGRWQRPLSVSRRRMVMPKRA